jgi:hypothetical protein
MNAGRKLFFAISRSHVQPWCNSSLFEFVCKLGFFLHKWASLKRERNERFKGPQVPKKAQFTQERVEYNVFFFV